jgi:hypothetical protein
MSAPMLNARQPMRVGMGLVLRMGLLLALSGFLAAVSLSTAERLYLVNGNTYAGWLATRSVPVSEVMRPRFLSRIHKSECHGNEPVWVFPKQNQYVLRCGDFWPFARTLIVPRNSATAAVIENSSGSF